MKKEEGTNSGKIIGSIVLNCFLIFVSSLGNVMLGNHLQSSSSSVLWRWKGAHEKALGSLWFSLTLLPYSH